MVNRGSETQLQVTGNLNFTVSNQIKYHFNLLKWFVKHDQLIKLVNLIEVRFSLNKPIFRHLKVEIALAFPASIGRKGVKKNQHKGLQTFCVSTLHSHIVTQ